MEQINNIKYQHNFKGKTLRGISKDTGHHFNTVKKYVEKTDFNINPKITKSKPRKLAPYIDLIDSWLTADLEAKPKQRHTAKRVYDRLKEIYPDFDVSDRSVRAYVSKKKKELGLNTQGYLPLEHPPGEAQVDFGEAQFVENGIVYDGYYLNMSFPYSNAGYLQIFKSQNQECLLEGMKTIFEYMGRVPTSIWFDNMSTAVKNIKKNGQRDITKGFERFMLHYGFRSNFCNPNSGHEKGHVECKVGYHRRNFLVPIPSFSSLEEYNSKLLHLCEEDMKRIHYNKPQNIDELFNKDLKAMDGLPSADFEVNRLEPVKANKYGKVRYQNRKYSTSPEYSGRELWLKVGANTVEILNINYETIVKHPRLYGDQRESMIWGPYLKLMAKRPTALKYTGFFKELPTTIQDYFDKCNYEEKKTSLKALIGMIEQTDLNTASRAFEETLRRNLTDTDSLLAIYNRLIFKCVELEDINLPPNLPEVKEYITDVTVYDYLMKGGLADASSH